MNKKDKADKEDKSSKILKAEIKSVISLLNEIVEAVEKDIAIDLDNQQKLTNMDIELSAQGKAIEEIGKKIDAVLLVLLGPQIKDFSLTQDVK